MITALLLAVLSVMLPFVSKTVREDKALGGVILALAFARQMASVGQVYFEGLPTVDMDPIEFQKQSAGGYGPLSRHPYGQFLSTVYSLFGISHLLGCELSQLAFSIALLCFVELIVFFRLRAQAPRLVFVFGFLPSVLLNTSVTLRESYQAMGLLALTLSLLKLARDGPSAVTFLLPVSIAVLVPLHQGFGLLVVILIPIAIIWIGRDRPIFVVATVAISVALLFMAGDRIWARLTSESTVLRMIDEGRGLEYIDGYQEGVEIGRSSFGTTLDAVSLGGLVRTGPIVFWNYMFAPMPWQVGGARDLIGLGETCLRLFLFGSCLSYAFRRQDEVPQRFRLLALGIYLLVELMWAAGTANWGTAFRHRVVVYGILVVLAGGNWRKVKPETVDAESGPTGSQSLRAQIRERRRRRSSVGQERPVRRR